jgi:hypothetical protein
MHCPYGHPYEGDNLIEMKVKQGGVYTGKVKRQCRQCKRNSHKSAKGKHRKPSLAQAAE